MLLFCFFLARNFSAFKKLFICLFPKLRKSRFTKKKKKKILVIMETGTHPGFPQILSPLSQCHDEPSRNSSSRLERGSFMRVEPEERVSFATHRGLLCLNEQQRVRVASSTNTFFHSSRSIDRTNGIVGIGLENSRRFCVTDSIR